MNRMAKGESIEAAAIPRTTSSDPAGSPMPMQSTPSGLRYMSTLSASYDKDIDRAIMTEEVKRISATYNEEQQRLDLMLKLQHTRQRQALQRKLLERKLPLPDVAANSATPATDGVGAQDQINIGPRQRLTIQKTIHQEAVKGLGFMPEKMNSISGINAAQKNTQSRGLSLGPLIRK